MLRNFFSKNQTRQRLDLMTPSTLKGKLEMIVGNAKMTFTIQYEGNFAGMDANGVSYLINAINNYITQAEAIMNDFGHNSLEGALAGKVKDALEEYINAIKDLLNAYITKFRINIEDLNKVQEAYTKANEELGQNMETDAADVKTLAKDINLDENSGDVPSGGGGGGGQTTQTTPQTTTIESLDELPGSSENPTAVDAEKITNDEVSQPSGEDNKNIDSDNTETEPGSPDENSPTSNSENSGDNNSSGDATSGNDENANTPASPSPDAGSENTDNGGTGNSNSGNSGENAGVDNSGAGNGGNTNNHYGGDTTNNNSSIHNFSRGGSGSSGGSGSGTVNVPGYEPEYIWESQEPFTLGPDDELSTSTGGIVEELDASEFTKASKAVNLSAKDTGGGISKGAVIGAAVAGVAAIGGTGAAVGIKKAKDAEEKEEDKQNLNSDEFYDKYGYREGNRFDQ